MTWTATLEQKEFVNGEAVIRIVYSDGTQKVEETRRAIAADREWLLAVASQRIQELVALEQNLDLLPAVGDVITTG